MPVSFKSERVGWSSPPDLYHAIGLLITQWSFLEALCKRTILFLVRGDMTAVEIMVSSLNSRSLLDILRKLIHHHDPQRAKEFDRLYPRMQNALNYRNDHAHASLEVYRLTELLGINNAKLTKVRLKKSGLEVGQTFLATPHSVRRKALFVNLVTNKFLDFSWQYFDPKGLPKEASSPQAE